ncbi:hypothetical protein MINTM008_48970 [Mycobacterium intracellulare]|uniref:Uncharacterized protein n=2 Tax=Mycobacterium avium complex (MAC) TaxID=120793 RepID=A0A7R7RP74_MYCIT|nr:hypothetical protein MPRI_13200 [Mycobacterium paraintracellulare]BCO48955.1 hypothetical protein MINTM002_46290 [Mycobacterium intracellulare]BCP39340.1 hypothetical protein MINTMi198_47100 [Mycobacterium intracellulare M.i.198]BCO43762.1 hypothetical protein MINTM001_49010 [Mycobacterium paraintracellulare]BCO54203.1 hypothetical protein MINTM003_46440 [Mycobacterium paraintracellulare]
MAEAWWDTSSACAAAAESQLTYWLATVIMAADDAPCHDPLARSDVTEEKDDADDANSPASPSHAAAAASSGPGPGPEKISAELTSGGNHAKCGFVTGPNLAGICHFWWRYCKGAGAG